MNDLAKTLIFFGLMFVAAGVTAFMIGKIPGIGNLPGDIYVRKGSFTLYFPFATCLLLSLILTLAVSLFGKK